MGRPMMPRDVSAMGRDGACVVCGASCPSAAHHLAHLRDGTAVVEMAYGKVDRVVPTSSFPELPDGRPPEPAAGPVGRNIKGPALPRTARSVYHRSFRP